jgi:hypothetical protein
MRAFASSVGSLALLLLAGGASGALQGCGASSSHPAGQPPATVPSVVDPPAPARGDVHITFAQGAVPVTRVQWAEPFVARIDGLIPGEEITLRSSSKLADGNDRAEAVFAADASGVIDTGTTAAVRGSYTGADADGLVWSMAKTTKAVPAADQYAFRADALAADGTALASATLPRWYVLDGITRVPVSDNGLVGVFYAAPGKTKRPVIVTTTGGRRDAARGHGRLTRRRARASPRSVVPARARRDRRGAERRVVGRADARRLRDVVVDVPRREAGLHSVLQRRGGSVDDAQRREGTGRDASLSRRAREGHARCARGRGVQGREGERPDPDARGR